MKQINLIGVLFVVMNYAHLSAAGFTYLTQFLVPSEGSYSLGNNMDKFNDTRDSGTKIVYFDRLEGDNASAGAYWWNTRMVYDPIGLKTFLAVAFNMRNGGADAIPSEGKPSWLGDYPWDTRYTAAAVVSWVREGFGLPSVMPTTTDTIISRSSAIQNGVSSAVAENGNSFEHSSSSPSTITHQSSAEGSVAGLFDGEINEELKKRCY